MTMKYKNVVWGLILVAVGILFILRNVGIVTFSWYSIWRLWPIILVLIGIAILPVKDGIKVLLSVITLLVAMAILILFPREHFSWNWKFDRFDKDKYTWEEFDADQRIFEPFDSSTTEAQLIFDAAAGNFRIADPTEDLFEFMKEGSVGRYNYSIKDLGSRKEIRFELDGQTIRGRNLKNKVEIKLNPEPSWSMNVDVGAADINLDLSKFRIEKLDIDGGAASIFIKIGNLSDETDINVDSGASSIEIQVPEEYACEVTLNTVLSSKNLEGFERVGDGTYVTPGFSDETRNIFINIEAAVSSLQIVRS